MPRRFFLLVLLLLLPFGVAQRCLDELRAGLPNEALSETASGRDAVRFLKRAVDLLEPTLPPLTNSTLPAALSPDDPVFDTAIFLAERGLLPQNWQPDTLAPAVWQTMLERVAAWYEPRPSVDVGDDETLSLGNLVADLSRLITAVTEGLEPLALIATDPGDRNAITFWAVIRNQGVYPRMVVVSPNAVAISLNGDPTRALPYLATCAVPLENYVTAPADVARQLFLANTDAEMVVAYSDPPALYNYRVPGGDAIAFLEFDAPLLEDIDRYAALFLGEGPGPLAITRLVSRVRTNMGPGQIMGLFR
ncbi:MAG: hypothetical protein U5L04_07685 [Trueperaceae bacterium]|nr:hypothetical protein [Trueperaceae bacterium]